MSAVPPYRGYSRFHVTLHIRKCPPPPSTIIGPEGVAISYERGTPVRTLSFEVGRPRFTPVHEAYA